MNEAQVEQDEEDAALVRGLVKQLKGYASLELDAHKRQAWELAAAGAAIALRLIETGKSAHECSKADLWQDIDDALDISPIDKHAKICEQFAKDCREEADRRAAEGKHNDAKEFAERAVAAEFLADEIRK